MVFAITLTSATEPLVNIALSHSPSQLVLDATHIHGTTQSTLGLVFVSESLSLTRPEATAFDSISSHTMAFFLVLIDNICPAKSNIVFINDFAKAADTSVLDLLDFSFSSFTSLVYLHETTIDDLWKFFKELIFRGTDKYILKKIKLTDKRNLWITRELILLGWRIELLRSKKAISGSNPQVLVCMRKSLKEKVRVQVRTTRVKHCKNF